MKKILPWYSILISVILIMVLLKEDYPQRLYKQLVPSKVEIKMYSYTENENFWEQTDMYSIYSEQKNIVMLGNSLIHQADWCELLHRTDIANRGITSDVTSGFLHRLKYVLNTKPKICFVEGGSNDLLYFGVPNDTIVKNFNSIVDTLLYYGITPVLNTVTYVTKNFNDAKNFNDKVRKLNEGIKAIAEKKHLVLIDLNPTLTDGNFRFPQFANEDGIHFVSKTYLVWKNEIEKILVKEKI